MSQYKDKVGTNCMGYQPTTLKKVRLNKWYDKLQNVKLTLACG